jgi:uncharacterized membrane protein YobD (UPF0266 family)
LLLQCAKNRVSKRVTRHINWRRLYILAFRDKYILIKNRGTIYTNIFSLFKKKKDWRHLTLIPILLIQHSKTFHLRNAKKEQYD